jgi:hypothetical protein
MPEIEASSIKDDGKNIDLISNKFIDKKSEFGEKLTHHKFVEPSIKITKTMLPNL